MKLNSTLFLSSVRSSICENIISIETEFCYNIENTASLTAEEDGKLMWLLSETFQPNGTRNKTYFADGKGWIVEVGPRLNFSTAWSTNAASIIHACGLSKIKRVERSRRYQVFSSKALSDKQKLDFIG